MWKKIVSKLLHLPLIQICKLISKFNFADNTVYELPDKKNLVIGKEGNSIPEMMFGYQD